MAITPLELIRLANREVREFFRQACQIAAGVGETPLTPAQVQDLSERLTQVSAVLGEEWVLADPSEAMRAEIRAYVANLDNLKQALETIRCSLMARRNQLEAERAHLEGARA